MPEPRHHAKEPTWKAVLSNALPNLKPNAQQVVAKVKAVDCAKYKHAQQPQQEQKPQTVTAAASNDIEMRFKVRKLRLVVVFTSMSLFALVVVWVLRQGVEVQQLGNYDNSVTDDEVQSVLNRLNTISGTLSSQLVNPIVASVMLILPLLYVFVSTHEQQQQRDKSKTTSTQTTSWFSLPSLVKFLTTQVVIALISAGFSSVYIASSSENVFRIIDSDLTQETMGSHGTNGSAAVDTILRSFLRGFDASPSSHLCAWNEDAEREFGTTDIYDDYFSEVLTQRRALTTSVDVSIALRPWMTNMFAEEIHPKQTVLDDPVLKDLIINGLSAFSFTLGRYGNTQRSFDDEAACQIDRSLIFADLQDQKRWNTLSEDLGFEIWDEYMPKDWDSENNTDRYEGGWYGMYIAKKYAGANLEFWQQALLEELHMANTANLSTLDGIALWNETQFRTERFQLAEGVWMDTVTIDIATTSDSTDKVSKYDLNFTTTYNQDTLIGDEPDQQTNSVPRSEVISGLECGAYECTYAASPTWLPAPQVRISAYTTPCLLDANETMASTRKARVAANAWGWDGLNAERVEAFDAFFRKHPDLDGPSGQIRAIYNRLNASETPFFEDWEVFDGLLYDVAYHEYVSCITEQSQHDLMVVGFGTRVAADRVVLDHSHRVQREAWQGGASIFNWAFDPVFQVEKARKWYTVSFGHVHLEMQQLDAQLGAECGAADCQGILFPLESLHEMLVLGKGNIERLATDYATTNKKVVTLNAVDDAPDVFPSNVPVWIQHFPWQQEDFELLSNSTNMSTLARTGVNCSVIADSYVNRISRNHLIMDKLQQVMYTSVMYYLFQNASVRTMNASFTSGASDTSRPWFHSVQLGGSYRVVTFKATVPFAAAIQSTVGVAVVFGVVLFLFLQREKRLEVSETRQVAELVHDEVKYPKALLACSLRSGQPSADGQEALVMPVDDELVAQEIVLKHASTSYVLRVNVAKEEATVSRVEPTQDDNVAGAETT